MDRGLTVVDEDAANDGVQPGRAGPCLSSSLIASSGDESAKKQNWVIWQRVSGHIRVQPCGKRKQMQSQSADDELACKDGVEGGA